MEKILILEEQNEVLKQLVVSIIEKLSEIYVNMELDSISSDKKETNEDLNWFKNLFKSVEFDKVPISVFEEKKNIRILDFFENNILLCSVLGGCIFLVIMSVIIFLIYICFKRRKNFKNSQKPFIF